MKEQHDSQVGMFCVYGEHGDLLAWVGNRLLGEMTWIDREVWEYIADHCSLQINMPRMRL